MNIAMLGHKRIPSREGGIEVVVEELAVRMVRWGHHVTCYNRKGHHVGGEEFDSEKTDAYKGIKLKSVFTIDKKGLAAVTSSVSAAVRAAFGGYDVVHFHAEGPCAMMWLPKLFGKRCICTIHGLDHKRAKWGKLASAYIMLGEKCAVRYADEMIVLSEGVQTYFKEVYNRNTVFIPNGVSRPAVRKSQLIKNQYGLEKDSYILFLGRLVPEKGIQYLIKAYKSVKTDKRLVIAGGSSDTDEFAGILREQAKEDKRIFFTGFVQGQMLEELYSNAYLYCLPSDLEGMPLSLLEAMSYGNCCLVSSIEECASIVKEKGMVFTAGNAGELKEKLQYACDHPETVALYKKEAADFICSAYDWDEITKNILELYEQ